MVDFEMRDGAPAPAKSSECGRRMFLSPKARRACLSALHPGGFVHPAPLFAGGHRHEWIHPGIFRIIGVIKNQQCLFDRHGVARAVAIVSRGAPATVWLREPPFHNRAVEGARDRIVTDVEPSYETLTLLEIECPARLASRALKSKNSSSSLVTGTDSLNWLCTVLPSVPFERVMTPLPRSAPLFFHGEDRSRPGSEAPLSKLIAGLTFRLPLSARFPGCLRCRLTVRRVNVHAVPRIYLNDIIALVVSDVIHALCSGIICLRGHQFHPSWHLSGNQRECATRAGRLGLPPDPAKDRPMHSQQNRACDGRRQNRCG